MRERLGQLGGRLAVGFIVAGLLLVFLGWNGAASWDRVQSQFPYLISGGIAGLCLVLIGVGLMIVQSQRADRATLEARLVELREAIRDLGRARGAGPPSDGATGMVVAGSSSFHVPGCKLLEGRDGLHTMRLAEALSRGLAPCRVCDSANASEQPAPARARRRTR